MEINMKKITKFAGAACAATGVVALSALVASGAAVGAVVEGFKAAGKTMKKMLEEEPQAEQDADVVEEVFAEADAAEIAAVEETVAEAAVADSDAVEQEILLN